MSGLVTGLRNEWRVVGRHPLTWAAVVGAAVFSALVVKGSPADPADGAGAALRWLNLFLPMFVLPFVAGALAPIIYLREVNHDLDGVIGSYPLPLRRWLAMRVGSLFLLLMLVCLLAEVSFVVALQADFPGQLGSLAQRSMGWLLLIQSPTCLLWASALAFLACRTASSGIIYFSAAAGWLLYLVVAVLTGSPMIAGSFVAFAPLKQAMLAIDPYAATALLGTIADSGPLQSRNVNVAFGRLFWLGISFFLLSQIRAVPALRGRFARLLRWTKPGSSARLAGPVSLHLRFVVRDKVFPLIAIGWFVLLSPEVFAGMDYVEPFAVLAPNSRDALNRVMWDMVGAIGPVMLLYFSDRICQMYRATRMGELYAATPHRPAALIIVQLISMWLVATAFIVLAGIAVFAAQFATGSPIQFAEYTAQMGLVLSRLCVFAALFVALHGLFRSRIAANLAGAALVALGSNIVASALGLEHPLARPLATPLIVPDAVWGYGGSLSAHGQVLAFWGALVLAALLLAHVWHHRMLPFSGRRASKAPRRPATAGAIALLALAAIQGTQIDAAMRAEGALVTRADRDEWRAQYERRFGAWRDQGQPAVAAIRSRVDFYPAAQRARLNSTMELVNRSAAPIDRLLIGRNLRDPGSGMVHLEGATVQARDAWLGQTVYRLARPLRPGERLALRFSLTLSQSGLAPAAAPLVLRERFNALPLDEILPVVGYKLRLQLRDTAVRREHGLPPLAVEPPSRLQARPNALRDDLVLLDSIVSTEVGQHGIAQGDIVQAWRSGGRSYIRFRTPMPIRNMPVFFSVPWAASLYVVGDHGLRVYAPQRLAADHPTILGTVDTLAWLDRAIGPYAGRTLNVIATPEIGLTGYALPQIVELSDRFAFRAFPSADAQFSQAYRRAAHEASHQWFGHQLGHGMPEERAFLTESLAKYAELVMMERRYGRKAMLALVDYERGRYRQERIDPERPVLPLIDADDGPDMYSRATLVFACLRARVGDDHIVQALRQSIDAQASGTPTRSIDFVRRLSALAPPDARDTVARLMLGTNPVERTISQSSCRIH